METPELVMTDGDEYNSDESSFYGDDATKAHFESLAAAFDPSTYLSVKRLDPSTLALQGQTARSLAREATAQLYNAGIGQAHAWQLTETAKDFVVRLPPTSRAAAGFRWLVAHNPHLGREHAVHTRRVERETVLAVGRRVLGGLERRRTELEVEFPKLTRGGVTRKMAKERRDAEREIHREARRENMCGGMWLLFPAAADLDKTWLKVVEGTVAGELGVSAWAGRAGDLERDSTMAQAKKEKEKVKWVIRVCTEDFDNKDDVERVLNGLREKKIIGPRENISYKTDVLFELGVHAANDWKINSIHYSAKDLK